MWRMELREHVEVEGFSLDLVYNIGLVRVEDSSHFMLGPHLLCVGGHFILWSESQEEGR